MFFSLLRNFLATRFPVLYQVLRCIKNSRRKQVLPDVKREVVYCADSSGIPRVNLVLPPTGSSNVFGGVATAFAVLGGLIDSSVRVRVLFESKCPSVSDVKSMLANYAGDINILSLEVSLINGEKAVPFEPVDRFIVTSWRTAYILQQIYDDNKGKRGCHNFPLVYLAQDYEPGFFSWSSEFALAMSTYQWTGHMIYLFNSEELSKYFARQHEFKHKSYVFPPVLNKALQDEITAQEEFIGKRKKRVVVYGRPSTSRNAFSLCLSALTLWAKEYPGAANWEVVSVGESHPEYSLAAGVRIRSLGKLSLGEYAELMLGSSVGLSLMISPHPSYPPLEMAVCGMNVLTNDFGTKSWSGRAPNIWSVGNLRPGEISRKLSEVCDKSEGIESANVNFDLMAKSGIFDKVIEHVKEDLEL